MAVLMVPFLRISLPISNIELKRALELYLYEDGISLPISNIELKRREQGTASRIGISLPISNIELKLCVI